MNVEETVVALMAAILISGVLASVDRDIPETDGIDAMIPDAVSMSRRITEEVTRQMNPAKDVMG